MALRFNFLFLLLTYISFAKSNSANVQPIDSTARITISFQNNTIFEVIDSIRLKTGYGFSYNPDFLKNIPVINSKFKFIPLFEILDSIFRPNQLVYQWVGSNIAITPQNNPVKSRPVILIPDTIKPEYIKAYGTVQDNDNQTIAYANIYIKNRAIGTITNKNGKFILNIPVALVDDTLQFSFIGFKTTSVPIHEFKSDSILIILQPATIELSEVVIRSVNPNEILQSAIDHIPDNYATSPQLLTAFYRETLSQNGRFVLLSEAVLKIFKAAYITYQNDQVTIFKGRKVPLSNTMDTISFKLQGGIVNSLLLDLAKNHSNFMSGENSGFYDYKFDSYTSVQDHLAYIITFDQKSGVPYALYSGKIYIDTESFAIIKAEFELSEKGMPYAAETLVQKSPRGVKVKPTNAHYLVNYSERNNKWYLSNVREEIQFKVRKKLNLFNINFHSVIEMAITHSDSTNVRRFRNNEIVKNNDIFSENTTRYDPQFWENFNYIPPEKQLMDAFTEIREKLEKTRDIH